MYSVGESFLKTKKDAENRILFVFDGTGMDSGKAYLNRELEDLRLFCSDDLLAVVVAASLANTVSENIFAAVCALNHAGHIELPNIGTSLVSSCLRDLSLRYSHFYTSIRFSYTIEIDKLINASVSFFVNKSPHPWKMDPERLSCDHS